jgi:hypothetical protein
MWRYLCSRVSENPKTEPAAFLEALPAAIDSTYVVATRVHEDDECPYVHPLDSSPKLTGSEGQFAPDGAS